MNLNYSREVVIFDDLDLQQDVKEIHKLLTSKSFPWYHIDKTIVNDDYQIGPNNEEYEFFQHCFVRDCAKNSDYMLVALKLLDRFTDLTGIKFQEVSRVQANYVSQKKVGLHSPAHNDQSYPHYVLLVYINDSDGDTVMYDNDFNEIHRITPKQGKIIMFDGSIMHGACPPVDSKYRIVFNYNLKPLLPS